MSIKFIYTKQKIVVDNITIPELSIGIVKKEVGSNLIIDFITKDNVIVNKNSIEAFDPSKVGDAFPNKVCNICHRFLPTEMFSRNQNGKGDRVIRRPSCDECRKILDGVSMSSRDKKQWEKTKPNLSIFTCPICRKRTIPGLTSKVVLDHNHKNGKPRAWICDSCNTGIGRFKDDIDLLKSAIIYLEKD